MFFCPPPYTPCQCAKFLANSSLESTLLVCQPVLSFEFSIEQLKWEHIMCLFDRFLLIECLRTKQNETEQAKKKEAGLIIS